MNPMLGVMLPSSRLPNKFRPIGSGGVLGQRSYESVACRKLDDDFSRQRPAALRPKS